MARRRGRDAGRQIVHSVLQYELKLLYLLLNGELGDGDQEYAYQECPGGSAG